MITLLSGGVAAEDMTAPPPSEAAVGAAETGPGAVSVSPSSGAVAPLVEDAAPPPTGGPPPAAPDAAEEEDDDADWRLPTGIVSTVLGTGFAVAFVYGFVRRADIHAHSGYEAFAKGHDTPDNACDAARNGDVSTEEGAAESGEMADLCDESDSLNVLNIVSVTASILFTGVGIGLIVSSDAVQEDEASRYETEASAWGVRMRLGEDGGQFALTYEF